MRANSKEVMEKVESHVLEYYTKEELKEQVDYIKQGSWKNWTNYQVGEHLAEGGCLLIYNGDIHKFLESLSLNNNSRKEFDNMQEFEMYKHLIGKAVEKILK